MAGLNLENGVLRGTIDLRAYRLVAIKKAAYRLADRASIVIGEVHQDHAQVSIGTKAPLTDTSAAELSFAFYQELLDQELREQVAEETASVRALILAQAFSKTDLIRSE